MTHAIQLPCNGDGICMLCGNKPSDEEMLTCNTCVTPWHVSCLSLPPQTLSSTLQWDCPDCSTPAAGDATLPFTGKHVTTGDSENSGVLIAAIRAIEADQSLTEQEKAKRRQQLLSGGAGSEGVDGAESDKKQGHEHNDILDLLDGSFNCAFCMQLPERPVTTPCGHNFCLKCFQKWVGQGKNTCAKCRHNIPHKMASQPRINSTLVAAIRMAKMSKLSATGGALKVYHFLHDQNRPDKAFTTERAKRAGKANAASGKIFVTIPRDYFGPITAEYDPVRNQGVLVGECWEDRMECRQWGAHFPHVSGIGGQSKYGAQSVALSGGYEDDEDHGEWFLYTGSGGRDLSGNKRTNKEQSFDQKFELSNEALRVSCRKGYPVRVVRSHKEKRSSYAPVEGVRYDGIYRIEKCWQKVGKQGFKVCRYLFVRCDNDPAPWTSDEHGDRPRPFPVIKELKHGTDVAERKENPAWDYDEEEGCWKWKISPPLSRNPVDTEDAMERKMAKAVIRQTKNMTVRQKLLKEFSCLICRKVMTLPVTTPCAHNFCKPCLQGVFVGQTFVRERTSGGRFLRAQKNVMKCPSCPTDISDFLQNPQVNRELMDVIQSLQCKIDEENVDDFEDTNKDGIDGTRELIGDAFKDAAGKEETERVKEKYGVPSGMVDDGTTDTENFGATNDSLDPLIECKPERNHKRQKVDDGDISLKIDEENTDDFEETNKDEIDGTQELIRDAFKEANKEDDVPSGKVDKGTTDSEKVGATDGSLEPLTECKPKRNDKRQKVDAGDSSLKIDNGRTRRLLMRRKLVG